MRVRRGGGSNTSSRLQVCWNNFQNFFLCLPRLYQKSKCTNSRVQSSLGWLNYPLFCSQFGGMMLLSIFKYVCQLDKIHKKNFYDFITCVSVFLQLILLTKNKLWMKRIFIELVAFLFLLYQATQAIAKYSYTIQLYQLYQYIINIYIGQESYKYVYSISISTSLLGRIVSSLINCQGNIFSNRYQVLSFVSQVNIQCSLQIQLRGSRVLLKIVEAFVFFISSLVGCSGDVLVNHQVFKVYLICFKLGLHKFFGSQICFQCSLYEQLVVEFCQVQFLIAVYLRDFPVYNYMIVEIVIVWSVICLGSMCYIASDY
eukprot:TRINITY_DN1176_c0_g1_i6.p1 TRINITY_DN1176_c0_g1~~TRINITY_DN1176_c0_g1_i6.p1  ORF type:complete len:314 (+),score=-27.59 TRINITY_DN1176_c0_g1_i6:98-1039(+)